MRPEEISLAAGVAARGMRDNPGSIALLGDDPIRRVRLLEPVFHWLLAEMQRPPVVARRNGVITGLAALSPPGQCFFQQTAARAKLVKLGRFSMSVAMPSIPRQLLRPLLGMGPSGMARFSAWGNASLRHDPQESHQHVELVAVEAALQRLGIGRVMMEELCRQIDKLPAIAYLETDKPENIRFYERFGFAVTGEETVIGTQVWYMKRPSTPTGG